MEQLILGLIVFITTWTFSLVYTSVFYHRSLAHNAIVLGPGLRRFVLVSGNWVTGIDPVGWVAMHRLHHANADGTADPHSPANVGFFGVPMAQLNSYKRVLARLARSHRSTSAVVEDLDADISWLNRRGLWWLPYLVHALIAIVLGLVSGMWFVALCYWAGLMAHPVQGWAVNAVGHRFGRRNYDTPDNSKNNLVVAILIMGEGLHNNHHAHPASASFSTRLSEPDLGYQMARLLDALGLLEIRRDHLIRRSSTFELERT
jgi:stearoyl-CoA desaturase (Delta-9 desaturase)